MKTTSLYGVLFLSVSFALADPPVDISYLPPVVQRTIKEWKGEGEVKKVKTLRMDGRTVYEVDYKERGDDKQIRIGEDGFVIGDERSQGKGKAKGKGKGKAKGRDRDDRDDDRDSDVNSPGDVRPPAVATNVPIVIDPTKPPVDTTPEVTPQPVPRIEAPSRPRTPPETTEPKTTKDGPAISPPATPPTTPPVTPPTLDPAQARAKLEVQVRSLTKLDNNRAAAAAGWNYVGQPGGVPYATIQQQRKAFPNLSPVAALLGNLIAQQGSVPFNKVTAERAKGRPWSALAEQYKVPVEPLVQAVDGLEKAMQTAAAGSQSGTPAGPAVTAPTIDAAQARAVLEQQVRTLTQLDNNPPAAAAGWNYVTQQGGVPYATIQQQRKAFPNLSPTAALLGNLISKHGNVPFNKVTAERAKGKQWGALAEQYKVPVESLSQSVSDLDKAMRAATTK